MRSDGDKVKAREAKMTSQLLDGYHVVAEKTI